MPVEDAISFVEENFTEYVQKARQRDIHVPDDIHNLLLDCIEARPLSVKEMERMIKYLKDRQTAVLLRSQSDPKRTPNAGKIKNYLTYTM